MEKKINILEPLLENGIRNANFFNGRILSAEDLKTEQEANEIYHRLLGQAIGEGVVNGLEVSIVSDGALPAIRVSDGFALNRNGRLLHLAHPVKVLPAKEAATTDAATGMFRDCTPEQSTVFSQGNGLYVFCLSPAAGLAEKVPVSLINDSGIGSFCGSRYEVQGIKFKAKWVELTSAVVGKLTEIIDLKDKNDRQSLSKLRNLLAYLCFGTSELSNFSIDPFARNATGSNSAYMKYGLLDKLRNSGNPALAPNTITNCDVPLALIYWTDEGILFHDRFSVYRSPVQPLNADPWPLIAGQRYRIESEAMFMQFQDHLRSILDNQDIDSLSVTADAYFRYLPPAGYIPVNPNQFDQTKFFKGIDVNRIEDVDHTFLHLAMHWSWFMEPIDLKDPPPINVYKISELSDYLFFTRIEERPEIPAAPADGGTQEAPTQVVEKTGIIVIDVQFSKGGEADKLIEKKFSGKITEASSFIEDNLDLEIGAICTARNNNFKAKFHSWGKGGEFQRFWARFVIESLPAGAYLAYATAPCYQKASRIVSVAAGGRLRISFDLKPEATAPEEKPVWPGTAGPGRWIDKGLFKDLLFMEHFVKWPWPPRPLREKDLIDIPIPPEIDYWLQKLAAWIRFKNPDAPVNPGDIRFVMDPEYTSESITDDPYAFVAFGNGGAYAPVVLTTVDRTLGENVLIGQGNLSGVGNSLEEKLGEMGVTRLDALGACWSGLISNTLNISDQASRAFISEAQAKVDELHGTLLGLGAMDESTANVLENADIENPVQLANADPNDLAAGDISLAFAFRLVEEARAMVPGDSWSLNSESLGLTEEEISKLKAKGLHTLEQLVSSEAEVIAALNIEQSEFARLSNFAKTAFIEAEVSCAGTAPVTRLTGVNQGIAESLHDMGIDTIGQLSASDVAFIAGAFDGDEQRAKNAINNAMARTLGIESAHMEKLENAALGTISNLATANIESVTAALQVEVEAGEVNAGIIKDGANAVINIWR